MTATGDHTGSASFSPVGSLAVDPATARIHEEGWQSWSASTTYGVADAPIRPRQRQARIGCWRPGTSVVADAFQSEGVLAVQPAAGEPVHLVGVDGPTDPPRTIRATVVGTRLDVAATGAVTTTVDSGRGGIQGALARWADRYVAGAGVGPTRRPPTAWCSWYHYFTAVTEADVDENLDAIERLDLPIDVVQIDDGFQAEIGDWLTPSDRFRSVPELLARIRSRGRRAGLWLAPFIAGARSDLVRRHPDWLVRAGDAPVSAGWNWNQELFALDLAHPGVQAYLHDIFATMRGWGADYFKIDFVYGGALPGRRTADVSPVEAYLDGLRRIRAAIGDAYLVGCGAPILPSVGLVDAMRISADTAPHWEPAGGDLSEPGARSAVLTGEARAWQQARFWRNDPDCLIVRPQVERREAWAAHVERFGGLRASSDRLLDLDAWGLETTRRLLATVPDEPFVRA